MKVIDLLNKIANGEKVPVKIKFRNDIFRYTGCSYYCDAMCTTLFNIYSFSILNEKVEIIEEDEKIEKITALNEYQSTNLYAHADKINKLIVSTNKLIVSTNKIIDKINKMEEK